MRRSNWIPLLPLTVIAVLLVGADECSSGADPCVVDGVVYEHGQSVPDDCNTCTCEDGEVTGCTEIACAPGGACLVDGMAYPDGAVGIPAPDGCNTCSCDDGVLGCTEIACGEPGSCKVDGGFVPDGTAVDSEDGCNTCYCVDGTISGCTELACTGPDACNVFGTLYEEGWAPAQDGCNTCQCEAGVVGAVCTEAACGPIGIVPCDTVASFETDAFDLNAVRVTGDTLEVDVAYSGGCAPHYFRLCYEPAFLESNPVQAQLRLEHDGQRDECEAYPSETRAFDLTPLRDAYRAGYGSGPADVILRLGDGATYSF